MYALLIFGELSGTSIKVNEKWSMADIHLTQSGTDALLPDLISDEWAVGEAGRLTGYVV